MNAAASPAEFAPSLHNDDDAAYRQPLSPAMRGVVLALVIFFHVGGAWALMQIQPTRLEVGEVASMEVRMVPAEQLTPPREPELNTPPPEDTPPPTPELESMIQPPLPDLPPPSFPVQAPPPKPKPPPPKPQPKPAPQVPTTSTPQAAAPAAPSAPRTVSASQVAYLTPPSPIYPARSRRAGEKGTVTVSVLIDATGRPTEVSVQGSSGHPALDESAVSAVRAARFRPYSEGGIPQAVRVIVPINFVLQ
jgi:periplasmic protein TonB